MPLLPQADTAVTASQRGRINGDNHDRSTIDGTHTGYHRVGGSVLADRRHIRVREHTDLAEGPVVQKQINSLPRRQPALLVLPCHLCRPALSNSPGTPSLELGDRFDLGHHEYSFRRQL
jgi:hypothetical protein